MNMDSNAAQFERLGHPWVTERDRREMPVHGPSKKIKRAGPKMATEKAPFAEPGTGRRPLTEAEIRANKHRETLQQIRRLARDTTFFNHIAPAADRPVVDPNTIPQSAEERAAGEARRLEAIEARKADVLAKEAARGKARTEARLAAGYAKLLNAQISHRVAISYGDVA